MGDGGLTQARLIAGLAVDVLIRLSRSSGFSGGGFQPIGGALESRASEPMPDGEVRWRAAATGELSRIAVEHVGEIVSGHLSVLGARTCRG